MPQNKIRKDSIQPAETLPGFPGYRNRDGRSGLDPLDTNREAASLEGRFYRNLFTLRVRTQNIFHLILMFVFGVIPTAVLTPIIIITAMDSLQNNQKMLLGLLIIVVLVLSVPAAITVNFIASLLEIVKIIPPLRPVAKIPKEKKKKIIKRRKDFR